MSKMEPGEIVRNRRENMRMTREQLAAQAETSTSTIARLELNNQLPKIAATARIARVLDIPLGALLPGSAVAS